MAIEDLSDKYLKFVISIEQSLTLGNYKEVLNCKNKAPHEFFSVWLERILETIRTEIARSAEKAYSSVKKKDAIELFHLNAEGSETKALTNFFKKQEKSGLENGVVWRIENDSLYFDSVGKKGQHINAEELMCNTLQYAHELERII